MAAVLHLKLLRGVALAGAVYAASHGIVVTWVHGLGLSTEVTFLCIVHAGMNTARAVTATAGTACHRLQWFPCALT